MAAIDDRDVDRLELVLRVIAALQRRLRHAPREVMYADDRDELDLTAYRLMMIGENTNKLSAELKARHPHVDWMRIYYMRNIVAHDYDAIAPDRIWSVAGDRLTELEAVCRAELARAGD